MGKHNFLLYGVVAAAIVALWALKENEAFTASQQSPQQSQRWIQCIRTIFNYQKKGWAYDSANFAECRGLPRMRTPRYLSKPNYSGP